MPISLDIVHGESRQTIHAEANQNLLKILQDNDFLITAPCAGQGKCGKCLVKIQDIQSDAKEVYEALACKTLVRDKLSIEIPKAEKVQIQTESYFPNLDLIYDTIENNNYGIAVDIGTTTCVVFLENLHTHENADHISFINPQQAYGADVISRIQYASGPDEVEKLQSILISELEKSFRKLCDTNKLPIDCISTICITGNTTMLHLFTGTDPSSLATYPFDPVFIEKKSIPATDIFPGLSSAASIDILPSASAFVGSDIVAGVAATELIDQETHALFLDIGTNGEMALGNKNKLLTCATAAGPAFEGAKISCGLGGVSGAIHQFSESSYKTIGNTRPTGLCGSGLIDVIAYLLDTKQLDASGYLEKAHTFLEEFKLELTPQDIREVQLAKGAIIAGIYTLINKAGINIDQIDKVYLAGGFGYAIDPGSAVKIGLLPEELEKKVIRAGNTAGLGARLHLHSADFRSRVLDIAERSDHFDLSMDMDFNNLFVMNMHFPS